MGIETHLFHSMLFELRLSFLINFLSNILLELYHGRINPFYMCLPY